MVSRVINRNLVTLGRDLPKRILGDLHCASQNQLEVLGLHCLLLPLNCILDIEMPHVMLVGVLLHILVSVLAEQLLVLPLEVERLQSEVELVDVVANTLLLHLLGLDIVTVCVVLGANGRHAANEQLVDQVASISGSVIF